jgi:hypothetical protein
MNAVPEAAQSLGAPGLAFETWETSAFNRFIHQERSLAGGRSPWRKIFVAGVVVRQTQSKDLLLLRQIFQ